MACNKCDKKIDCKTPCYFLDYLISETTIRLKEFPMMVEQDVLKSLKYGEVIAEIIATKKKSDTQIINRIRLIADHRLRAYAAMIYAGLSVLDISKIKKLNVSIDTIYKSMKKNYSKYKEPVKIKIDKKLLLKSKVKKSFILKMIKEKNCWVCIAFHRCSSINQSKNGIGKKACKNFKYNLEKKR
mgnify:CR=1 FL=1